MPRQVDLGPGLPVTHNALERLAIEPHVGKIDVAAILEQWSKFLEEQLLKLIKDVAAGPGKFLKGILDAVNSFLGFNGLIPVSWIADVVQDLSNGAGEFPNAASVTENPYFVWDSATPGWKSGGSVKVIGNGTRQSMRTEIFDVVAGQVLSLEAAASWTDLVAAAGSNPIKVGFATFDIAGNPLPDVITGQLQPPAAAGAWRPVPTSNWTVTTGVARAAALLILDAGATAGTVHFSNVLPHKTNKLPPNIVESLLEEGADLAEDIRKTWDNFWNGVFGGTDTGKTPADVKTAAGQLKSVADDANAAAQFASSMVIRPRRSPRWISTGTHDDVSFPVISAQTMFAPALNDITFIPITPDTDRVYKTLKFGLVGNAMTNCYVGVYKIGTDGTLTLATNLGDKKSVLTASKVQTFSIPDLSVGRGETVFLAVRQVGGVAGQMFSTPSLLQVTEVVQPIPVYPTEKANTSSGLPATISGAIVRAESAPAWGALGETLLDSPWTDFLGPGTYTFTIPSVAKYLYMLGSGSGGGGGGGDGGWDKPGEGGRRGSWSAVSLERGVGIPAEVTQLNIVVPAGGAGAPGKEQNGSAGSPALITYTLAGVTTTLLAANGGAAGRLAYGNFFNRDPVGEAQVNYPFFGRLFVGGLEAAQDASGNSPGGGGGGGDGGFAGSANGGRQGGAGFCAVRTA